MPYNVYEQTSNVTIILTKFMFLSLFAKPPKQHLSTEEKIIFLLPRLKLYQKLMIKQNQDQIVKKTSGYFSTHQI